MTTDYENTIKDWQKSRFDHLTAEDGWLNVIGRFWLEDGIVTIGSDPGNDVVLPVGPAHLGRLSQRPGEITVTLTAPDAAEIVLVPNPTKPPRFSVGSLRFEVTTMEGRNALRARDVDAPERLNFEGLEYFPVDPTWRVPADWIKLDPPVSKTVDTVLGIAGTIEITRKAVFTYNGIVYELLPTHGTAQKPQFVIRDLTSRTETYGASRFLYGEELTDRTIVLDFNKAFNPPCAFTDYAACPLPLSENILPVRIEAGEKKPHGH